MGKVKYSAEAKVKADKKITTVNNYLGYISQSLDNFTSDTDEITASWKKLYCDGGHYSTHYYTDYNATPSYDSSDKDKKNPHYPQRHYYTISDVPGAPGSRYETISDTTSAIKTYIDDQITSYNGFRDNAVSSVSGFSDEVKQKVEQLSTLLNNIATSIDTFEDTPVSIKEAIEKLWSEVGLSLDGISFKEVTFEDGTIEKVMFTYTDEDGKEITIDISEALNAFYTYTGSSMESSIKYETVLESMNLTESEKDAYRAANILDTHAYVDKAARSGLFKLASSASIGGFYGDVVSKNTNATVSKNMDVAYNNLLRKIENKIGKDKYNDSYKDLLTSSVGGLFVGAGMEMANKVRDDDDFPLTRKINFNNKNDATLKRLEEQKAVTEEKAAKAEEYEEKRAEADAAAAAAEAAEAARNTKPSKTVDTYGDDGYGDVEFFGDEDVGGESIPSIEELTDDDFPDTEVLEPTEDFNPDIIRPTQDEVRPAPERDALTNDDIDSLAQDAYFDKYTPEQLANYRNEQVNEFDSLFNSDDKSDLIDFYNDAGYDLNDAKILADNKELGLAAFLAAKQSADLADLSKSIAQSSNMNMSMFDTRFDNGASYGDLMSGKTNAFLSNPSSDPNVSSARETMNNAKSNYDSAVDKAKKSVDNANENKEKLDNVKKKITRKSGGDSSKWSDEDVKEYNDAVNEYNDSVKQANDDVAAAQNAKNEYESSKDIYESSKQEFYDKVQEEMAENINNNANSNSSDDFSSQGSSNGEDLIPDVPDGNNNGNGSPGTDDSGMGFGKPSDNTGSSGNTGGNTDGNTGGSDLSTPPENDGNVGVDDSGSGLGFRDDNDFGTGTGDQSGTGESSDDNSEYIYDDGIEDSSNDDSEPRVSNSGIGF